MKVNISYGKEGLEVSLPAGSKIVMATPEKGLPDPAAAIRQALRSPMGTEPLAKLVKPGDTVVIVHSDITRPAPNQLMIPALTAELEAAGVRREDITLLNGLGTHRKQSDAEMRQLLGDYLVDSYHCAQHDAFDDSMLVNVGRSSQGNEITVNRLLVEADVKILTGFVEPHLFAGFSGGPKAVLPAAAGAACILSNHGQEMLNHPKATWGVIKGNPAWQEMLDAALLINPTFILNVTLNEKKEVTGVFAGDMLDAHAAAREHVRQQCMVPVNAPFDVVLTCNSGYPLDQNLYQSVKGMSAAKGIVKEGGTIIICARCQDGVPDHGRYAELLREAGSPQGVMDMMARPHFGEMDQWQIQIQAMIQLQADVYVYSEGLTDQQIEDALFRPCRDVEGLLAELSQKYGPDARICVMPDGPQTLAYVK